LARWLVKGQGVKGTVFTEFLEMVEAKYSPAVLEDMIASANVTSCGAYTAVGTYPHQELVALLTSLCAITGETSRSVMLAFGDTMFTSYRRNHSHFFDSRNGTFDLLEHVENYIHKQVKKLYPGARPPQFDIECHTPERFTMVYRSSRPFADLCEGLILASLRHYGENCEIHRTDLESGSLTRVRFDVIRCER
jgi:hypothetical protein